MGEKSTKRHMTHCARTCPAHPLAAQSPQPPPVHVSRRDRAAQERIVRRPFPAAPSGRGDDSWEPIPGLPKHLVIRLAKQKKFTLPDDAFPTSPAVLAPCPPQPDWVCVAVQQHTDETGAVLVDARWNSATTSHEETVPPLWASSLLAEFPDDPPPAHWALGRPAFEKLDAA